MLDFIPLKYFLSNVLILFLQIFLHFFEPNFKLFILNLNFVFQKNSQEASKETLTHSDVYDFDENDATYVERNVLQEEATTLQTETISVEKLRQRYDSG